MDIPKLSEIDKKTWESLQLLREEDLYAMLGSEPKGFYQPISAPESLLVGYLIPITAETIAKGRDWLSRILPVIREKICERWKKLRQKTSAFDRENVWALLLELIRQSIDYHHHFPCEAAAELICRACEYNLDKFCGV
jgi:hypothetical protein